MRISIYLVSVIILTACNQVNTSKFIIPQNKQVISSPSIDSNLKNDKKEVNKLLEKEKTITEVNIIENNKKRSKKDNSIQNEINSLLPEYTKITEPKKQENVTSSSSTPLGRRTSRTIEEIRAEILSINTIPNFSSVKEVQEGIRNSYITLIFKDKDKVRISSFEQKSLKSLVDSNVFEVNNLFKKYNVAKIETTDSALIRTEEELELEEKESEAYYKIDYPNKASIYYIYAENINVKEFIDKLRQKSIVLSANENSG